jgi:protein-S-isoprenylcysteine O-methyltransferase Ste14
VVPVTVAAEQLLRERRLRPAWSPLMVAGYLSYRLAGRYRLRRAGGPPGMSQGMPDRLIITGPYAATRNPMYLGHLVFLAGLAMVTRSPLAALIAAAHVPWFAARVRRDELRLRERFGAPYEAYCARVPRWVPAQRPYRRAARHRRMRPRTSPASGQAEPGPVEPRHVVAPH